MSSTINCQVGNRKWYSSFCYGEMKPPDLHVGQNVWIHSWHPSLMSLFHSSALLLIVSRTFSNSSHSLRCRLRWVLRARVVFCSSCSPCSSVHAARLIIVPLWGFVVALWGHLNLSSFRRYGTKHARNTLPIAQTLINHPYIAIDSNRVNLINRPVSRYLGRFTRLIFKQNWI